MRVVERVVDHAPGPPVADDPGGSQQPQRVRDGALRSANGLGQVADAQLAALQQCVKETSAGGIGQQLKQVSHPSSFVNIDKTFSHGGDSCGIDRPRGTRVKDDYL